MTTDNWISIAFAILAIMLVGSSLAVVIVPRIVHAALALVLFFFVMSGIYILLQAEFIAATQVIIYIGAITVLFLFAIMLTHNNESPASNPVNSQWPAAALVALAVFGTTGAVVGGQAFPPSNAATPGGVGDVTSALGQLLMGPFVLPFEIAGLLLLAAMIGAIVIARES